MTNFESKTDIQQILTNIHQYHYTTNPHERSASNGLASCLPSAKRATIERPLSKFARQALGGCLASAQQTTCSAMARRALVGISGVDMERFQNMNDLLTQESVIC